MDVIDNDYCEIKIIFLIIISSYYLFVILVEVFRKYTLRSFHMYYKLTNEQKDVLVESIIEKDGLLVSYMEFSAIYFEITETSNRFYFMTQPEYDQLLDELWNLYEQKRNDSHSQPGIIFNNL